MGGGSAGFCSTAAPTCLSRWRIIYRPLAASNTNVCLNCPQPR
ncbi:hypothetical protein C4K01_4500 [Pseudomonas synxantha]|nr:hypothetical protein C4K01_4500 [Pseudomonas synxantha]